MYWEEYEEEELQCGSIEIQEYDFIGAVDTTVKITLNLTGAQYRALQDTKSWREVCNIIESTGKRKTRRIGF